MARPRKARTTQNKEPEQVVFHEVDEVKELEAGDEADAPSVPYTTYTITKPHDQYVVKNGGNVVYANTSREKCEEYLSLLKR